MKLVVIAINVKVLCVMVSSFVLLLTLHDHFRGMRKEGMFMCRDASLERIQSERGIDFKSIFLIVARSKNNYPVFLRESNTTKCTLVFWLWYSSVQNRTSSI